MEELDEGIDQEEKDAATGQAAEGWGATLGFLVGGEGAVSSQDSSLYLNHNQEADGEEEEEEAFHPEKLSAAVWAALLDCFSWEVLAAANGFGYWPGFNWIMFNPPAHGI